MSYFLLKEIYRVKSNLNLQVPLILLLQIYSSASIKVTLFVTFQSGNSQSQIDSILVQKPSCDAMPTDSNIT